MKLSEQINAKIAETKTHYVTKTGLKEMASLAKYLEDNQNPAGKECVCEWPDKTLRKVMVTSVDHGTAHVIWNERHAPIDGQGCVVGMEDTVPVEWLYIPANAQGEATPPEPQ